MVRVNGKHCRSRLDCASDFCNPETGLCDRPGHGQECTLNGVDTDIERMCKDEGTKCAKNIFRCLYSDTVKDAKFWCGAGQDICRYTDFCKDGACQRRVGIDQECFAQYPDMCNERFTCAVSEKEAGDGKVATKGTCLEICLLSEALQDQCQSTKLKNLDKEIACIPFPASGISFYGLCQVESAGGGCTFLPVKTSNHYGIEKAKIDKETTPAFFHKIDDELVAHAHLPQKSKSHDKSTGLFKQGKSVSGGANALLYILGFVILLLVIAIIIIGVKVWQHNKRLAIYEGESEAMDRVDEGKETTATTDGGKQLELWQELPPNYEDAINPPPTYI